MSVRRSPVIRFGADGVGSVDQASTGLVERQVALRLAIMRLGPKLAEADTMPPGGSRLVCKAFPAPSPSAPGFCCWTTHRGPAQSDAAANA